MLKTVKLGIVNHCRENSSRLRSLVHAISSIVLPGLNACEKLGNVALIPVSRLVMCWEVDAPGRLEVQRSPSRGTVVVLSYTATDFGPELFLVALRCILLTWSR